MTKARRGGAIPEAERARIKAEFLVQFPRLKTIRAACEAVDICRVTFYDWKRADPEFAKAFEDAEQDLADLLEESAIDRATSRENPSDTLLIFMLKGLRPEKYRERFDTRLTGKDGGPVEWNWNVVDPPKKDADG